MSITFTTEKKADKFTEIIVKYGELMAYRRNLTSVIMSNYESFVVEEQTESGGVILKQTDKITSAESLIKIQIEVDRVDTILSFIGSIVYGDENKPESQNYEDTDSKQNSEF